MDATCSTVSWVPSCADPMSVTHGEIHVGLRRTQEGRGGHHEAMARQVLAEDGLRHRRLVEQTLSQEDQGKRTPGRPRLLPGEHGRGQARGES